jgi:Zn-dependent protease with chaperone function
MDFALATLVFALVLSPHLLPQTRLAPISGVTLWLAVLALRALLALLLALVVVLYLPATQLFQLLTHWCIHAVVPFLAAHLGFSGHGVGDAATLVPVLILSASLISAAFGIWRGARAVGRWVRGNAVGPGPRRSLVVGGPGIVVAAAGLRDPKVLVSAGALASLDEEELAAGLEHEWGHVARHHRFLLLLGQLLFAVSRPLPGTRRALEALHFHLERDADDYAVRRTGDSLALASAICKAAVTAPPTPTLAGLGGAGVAERLRLLSSPGSRAPSWPATVVARTLAATAATLVVALAVATPGLAQAGLDGLKDGGAAHACRT